MRVYIAFTAVFHKHAGGRSRRHRARSLHFKDDRDLVRSFDAQDCSKALTRRSRRFIELDEIG